MFQKHSQALLLFLLLLLLQTPAAGQKEGAIWYFGYNAGLDFTRHYPQPLTDGKIATREGVASISSEEGDLLFYTDGSTVWNKNHQVMENGDGLFGNTSSTQSSIVVPTPDKQYEYYIFTVDVIKDGSVPGKGLNWSKVDMFQNNRFGRVLEKNMPLASVCVEKITAVKHDKKDENDEEFYWIIAHGWNNNRFLLYKLTKNGVTPAPGGMHQQDVGMIHKNVDDDGFDRGAVGYLKSSPKGDFLALAVESLKTFEVFRFDKETGKITFMANLPAGEEDRPDDAIHAAYGVEFSPTSNYLYGSTRKGGKIYRWNLEEKTQQAIRQSILVINPGMDRNTTCGALQLAFNGKIYVCFAGKQYLGVINSPTQDDCHFVELGASLIDNIEGTGGQAYYGLPTFLPDFFRAAEFYYENTCQNDLTIFYLSTVYMVTDAPKWTIYNESGTGYVGNVSVDKDSWIGSYRFSEPGNYIVELEVNQSGDLIRQKREITIHALPELNFNDTTILCAGKTVVLDAGDGAFYRWSDNVNLLERMRTIGMPGWYSVHVTHNNGCTREDSTQVIEKPLPVIKEVITTQASCALSNGSIRIITEKEPGEYTFRWKNMDDSTGNHLNNLPGGLYEVEIISKETGCSLNRKITVSETGAPEISISPSIEGTVCPGTELSLTASGAANYRWVYPEGDSTATINIKPYHTDTYVVEGYSQDANGNKCFGFEEIPVEVYPYDPPELGPDASLCEGQEKVLDGLEKYDSWYWSTGETSQLITVRESIDTLILYTKDHNGCTFSDTISIEFKPLPVVDLGLDRTVCGGPEILDAGEADQYLWNTGDTVQQINVVSTGTYSVQVTTRGCSGADDVIVRVNDPDHLQVVSVDVKHARCHGSSDAQLVVIPDGDGSFYEYSLDEGQSWVDNSGVFENLTAGLLSLMVREDSACVTSWPEEIEILQPDEIETGYQLVSPSCDQCQDGQIILDLRGGTPPYDILWSNFETGMTRVGLGLGDYSVSVADSRQCKSVTTITLEPGHGAISIPNAFTPNADGMNDTWILKALYDYPEAEVTVFDRTGKIVFLSPPGYPDAWDGRNKGDYVPMGTYYYTIKLNDAQDPISGSLTIIR